MLKDMEATSDLMALYEEFAHSPWEVGTPSKGWKGVSPFLIPALMQG